VSTRNPIKDQVAVVGIGQHRLLARERRHVALARARGVHRRDPLTPASPVPTSTASSRPAEPGGPSPAVIGAALGLDNVTHYTRPAPSRCSRSSTR
jgi:hypothetical protein